MEILIKGKAIQVNCGDTIIANNGLMGVVTMEMNKAVVIRTDTNDVAVIETKDIVSVIVQIIEKSGLLERFFAWVLRGFSKK